MLLVRLLPLFADLIGVFAVLFRFGKYNSGQLVTVARDNAVAKGITINGLAIINEKPGREPGTVFYEQAHPPGGLSNDYRENVTGGAGAFVLQIMNFDTSPRR